MIATLLIGLTVLGSISPLLTFTALFQLKEWRVDRLREHLRREGWLTLVGTVRPALLLGYALGMLLLGNIAGTATFIIFWLALFAGLSVSQLIAGKQRMPVWTSKAKILVGLSALFTLLLSIVLLSFPHNLPIVPLLQPAVLFLSWLIFFPVDRAMKRRLMEQARMKRMDMGDITVIGIAGSVGKTTTKELIATLLADLNPVVTPSHVNTEMGVASWLLSLKETPTLLIVEMGAYAKGEIALLSHITQPTIGVITALGSDHLGLFGSEENIVEANAELITALPENGHLFLDGYSQSTSQLLNRASCSVTVTDHASNIQETAVGMQFSVFSFSFSVPLHGKHNVANAALAISVAHHLGVSSERIDQLLATVKPVSNTFNVRTESDVLILDDTYNISPLSLRAALDWSATQTQRPRTLLTSGLLELGKDEDRILGVLGAHARGCAERVIFTTESGRAAFEKGYGSPIELLNDATKHVSAGSVLLCVGRMPTPVITRLLPRS